jgi:hypothetical protein
MGTLMGTLQPDLNKLSSFASGPVSETNAMSSQCSIHLFDIDLQ